ncbi:MAG: hypothetical protein ACREEE_18110 [Dongiaceae bacterium]
MKDLSPGLHPRRLVALMHAAIERCQLDLSGRVVLTEAASGAYVVTPVLAATAGAKEVYAVTRSTRYGTVDEVTAQTLQLAGLAGVKDRIKVITQKSPEVVAQADIVTNSGHVRPIDATMIASMKPTAVIALMYEAWEFRRNDVDLEACRQRGIQVAGTNERHPAVDVFSFLGIMAVKMLMDAGVAVVTSRILLLCDNPFGPFIERGLKGAGADVDALQNLNGAANLGSYDAILVALQPRPRPVLKARDALLIARYWPGAVVAQFWGDLDRPALLAADIPVWPSEAPAPGHMGILPSAIGPEPIVRLQTGGLKVAEQLLTADNRTGRHRSGSTASGR